MSNVKYLVYTTDLKNISFVEENKIAGIACIPVLDARTAVYIATGICAQNDESVMVCLNSSNASRSAFSGMTEAFYRKLPIILVTLGNGVDYTRNLKDVAVEHYVVSGFAEIDRLIDVQKPIHIEVLNAYQKHEQIECIRVQQLLSEIIDESEYLYISHAIKKEAISYNAKVVLGGMRDCYEGALANVLGASLAKKRTRYIGVLSEEEFLHDMNTLGNININDLILYIVVGKKKNSIIMDYALSLGFQVKSIKKEQLQPSDFEKIYANKKKSLLIIYEEE